MRNWSNRGVLVLILAMLTVACSRHEVSKNEELPKPEDSASESKAAPSNMIIKKLQVIEIDSVGVSSNSAAFKVTVQTPDMCWKFSHFEVEKTDTGRLITVFGKRDPGDMCAQMISSFDANITVDVPEGGTYECKFWCGDSEMMSKSVEIPD